MSGMSGRATFRIPTIGGGAILFLLLVLLVLVHSSIVGAQSSQNEELFDVRFGKHLFHLKKETYWRENYNAHSYYIIVFSFVNDDGVRYLVPIEDDKHGFSDIAVDAPGADCFRKETSLVQKNGSTYLIIVRNESEEAKETRAVVFKATYSEEGLPGFPPLYFKKIRDMQLAPLCNPEDVNGTKILGDMK